MAQRIANAMAARPVYKCRFLAGIADCLAIKTAIIKIRKHPEIS